MHFAAWSSGFTKQLLGIGRKSWKLSPSGYSLKSECLGVIWWKFTVRPGFLPRSKKANIPGFWWWKLPWRLRMGRKLWKCCPCRWWKRWRFCSWWHLRFFRLGSGPRIYSKWIRLCKPDFNKVDITCNFLSQDFLVDFRIFYLAFNEISPKQILLPKNEPTCTFQPYWLDLFIGKLRIVTAHCCCLFDENYFSFEAFGLGKCWGIFWLQWIDKFIVFLFILVGEELVKEFLITFACWENWAVCVKVS